MQIKQIPRAAIIKYFIWVIGLPIALLFTAWLGIAIGYAVIGDMPWNEAFSSQVWKHMYQLVFG